VKPDEAEVEMPERELKKKPAPQRREDTDTVESPETTESETGNKIKAELDELLDEIDDVLETNAEDFVKSYIQKGGE
jgi:prokaryotic ubiquitin-like protein Pup